MVLRSGVPRPAPLRAKGQPLSPEPSVTRSTKPFNSRNMGTSRMAAAGAAARDLRKVLDLPGCSTSGGRSQLSRRAHRKGP